MMHLLQHLISSATDCRHSLHNSLLHDMTRKPNSVWHSTTSFRRVYFWSLWQTHSGRRTRTWLAWYRSVTRNFLQWFCATSHSTRCILHCSCFCNSSIFLLFYMVRWTRLSSMAELMHNLYVDTCILHSSCLCCYHPNIIELGMYFLYKK